MRFDSGRLVLEQPLELSGDETLIVALRVRSGWLGRFIDPFIELSGGEHLDHQTFERGVDGLRYLNLSGQAQALAQGTLRLRGRFCRLQGCLCCRCSASLTFVASG